MVNEDSDSDLDVRRPPAKKQDVAALSGLVHGKDVKAMLDQSRSAREATLMDDGGHGRHEAPVHRVGGKIVSKEEWKESQRSMDPRFRRERQRELDREFEKKQRSEWKQGLDQSAERQAKAEEAFRIASEPIGSNSSRRAYDEELRGKQRWDDPLSCPSLHANEDLERPRCRFQAPPNRFNIQPGYRWDGVVRGNDFEKRWFERTNEAASKRNRL
jgi:pre-mRNA-splicing factor CWC26